MTTASCNPAAETARDILETEARSLENALAQLDSLDDPFVELDKILDDPASASFRQPGFTGPGQIFLYSDAAQYLSGAIIPCDGGRGLSGPPQYFAE